MANLQIKGIDDGLYAQIKELAATEHRSVSQQVLSLIKAYFAKKERMTITRTPAEVLLDLAGSWEDTRTAEEIVTKLRHTRKNSRKLTKGF